METSRCAKGKFGFDPHHYQSNPKERHITSYNTGGGGGGEGRDEKGRVVGKKRQKGGRERE